MSEGKQAELIAALRSVVATAAGPQALLANVFADEPYNRSNFTLISRSSSGLANAAVTLARAALASVDLRRHAATHPRLGAVDHISCHPLTAPASHMQHAIAAAQSIAQQLGEGPHAVPTYLYGHAHPAQQELADIRRQLGYCAPGAAGDWAGALDAGTVLPCAPAFGPASAPPQSGVCCVGAAPWVVNYNVLLRTDDLAAARHVARAVSQRAGGLRHVQSMALQHDEGIEVACNLLDPGAVGPGRVDAAVRAAAAAAGLGVIRAYRIGKSIEDLVQAADALQS